MTKFLTDRVKKIAPNEVSADRYQFIKLSETEPDLGLPPVENSVLSSELDGTRKWLTFDRGFEIDFNNRIVVDTRTVDIDTSDFFNSESQTLDGVLSDLDNAIEFKEITTDETILGLGNSLEPLSIGQAVKPTDNVEFNTILTNSVTFTNEDSTSTTGKLQWNNQHQTLILDLSPDTILNIGQQTVYLVKNTTGQLIPKGTLVSVNGIFENDKSIITIAPWTDHKSVKTIIGFTTSDINNDEEGFVINQGQLENVNTTGYTGLLSDIGVIPNEDSSTIGEVWDSGDYLYLTDTDRLTNVKPEAPNNKSIVAQVIKVHPQIGSVFVRIIPSSDLSNDDLLEINNLLDKDILRYSSLTNRFENVQQITTTVSEAPPQEPNPGDLWWDTLDGNLYIYYVDQFSAQWVAASIGPSGARGFTGSQGDIGFTGSQGEIGFTGSQGDVGFTGSKGDSGEFGFTGSQGTQGNIGQGLTILGSLDDTSDLPLSGNAGDAYLINGDLYVWDGSDWQNVGNIQGETGFTGSKGETGFTGSKGDIGFTGSKGDIGFTGSQGDIGFTGSRGIQGLIGFTGSQGDIGFTGSKGDTGEFGAVGFTGSKGDIGFTGSKGDTGEFGAVGFTGSQGTQGVIGFTGSRGNVGFTGSQGDIGFTGSQGISANQTLNTTSNVQFNSVGVGTSASGTTGEIRATGNITAYFSDDRLKNKLSQLDLVVEKLKTLDTFYYEPNQTAMELGYEKVKDIGLSAQQVQNIFPEIVVPAPIDEQYLTVRYEKLIPVLIKAINELSEKITRLELK